MCGRYTLTVPADEVQEVFRLDRMPDDYRPRYNICPSQEAPVIRVLEEVAGGGPASDDGPVPEGGAVPVGGAASVGAPAPAAHRRCDLLRWGLVPFWAKDPAIGNKLINARSESAASKPAFRDSFRKRRCLVVADGFFEWRPEPGGKQPYWIHRPDGRPFAFAGLWSRWDRDLAAGEVPIETFTILTRDALPEVAEIHDRMPVILAREDHDAWLDPTLDDVDRLVPLLRRPVGTGLELRPVSRRVNSPANDVPEVLERDW